MRIQVNERNVSYKYSVFRKIHTYANIFYFSVRVSSSHVKQHHRVVMPPPVGKGAISVAFVGPSVLPYVCLSVRPSRI